MEVCYKRRSNRVLLGLIVSCSLMFSQTTMAKQEFAKHSETPVKITFNKERGVANFVTGKFQAKQGVSKLEAAKGFLKGNRFFNVPESFDYKVKNERTDKFSNSKLVRMTQSVNDVEIFGSDMIVRIDDQNQIHAVSGNVYNFTMDTKAQIDETTAVNKAFADMNARVVNGTAKVEKKVFVKNGGGVLTWHVNVQTIDDDRTPGDWHYFIDAKNGKLVSKYNNVKTQKDRKTYDANNGTSLPGSLRISEGGSGGDTQEANVHQFGGEAYDYFFNNHGRDSFDGNGATITQTVHYDNNYVNAYWNGSQLVYGDGDGSQSGPLGDANDVVYHEFGHAVTDYSADLVYSYQSGALNESFSDVWAAIIDSDDWLIGEDCWTPGTAGDALRYMDVPENGNQPSHMNDYYNTSSDNGGVHTNSGIPNKAFYNIATSIGRSDAGKIYYRALTVYLTASSDFAAARTAIVQSAEDLFGASSAQKSACESGFDAVGIMAPPDDFTGTFVASSYSTPHNYTNNQTYTKTYTHAGATGMKVNFTAFNTESGYDYVRIKDGTGAVIYSYSGNLGAFSSGPVNGETITVELTTDYSVTAYGFDIDGYYYNGSGSGDTTPPVISNVSSSNISATTATITWTTNEASDSKVDYGTSTSYGSTKASGSMVTSHSLELTGLAANTTYNYMVSSADASANSSSSSNLTFTTDAQSQVDVVTITKSQYRSRKDKLTVEATSSYGNSETLTVVGFGDLNWNSKKNLYRKVFTGVTSNPGSITVNSTGGGSATSSTIANHLTGNSIPDEPGLSRNSPNPFNPITSFEYDVPEATTVRITIYNMLGQVVKTLVNGSVPAGVHQITWDATNSSGHKVPSGMYVYQYRANNYVESRKMVLLK